MSRALWNATKSLWEEILQKGKFIPRAATSSSFPSPSNYDNLINSFAIIALNWTGTFQKLTDYNIGWFSAKLLHDPLEAGVFSDFGCGVNILDGEQGAQAEQEDLGQSGHELKQGNSFMHCYGDMSGYLGLRHDHIDTVRPGLDQLEALVSEGEPAVSVGLNITAQGHPVLALVAPEQTSDIVSW